MLLVRLLDLYALVVLAAVVVSWMQLRHDHPVVKVTNALVEPVLAPIRRVLPAIGGLDLSPLVLLVGLRVLRSLL